MLFIFSKGKRNISFFSYLENETRSILYMIKKTKQ